MRHHRFSISSKAGLHYSRALAPALALVAILPATGKSQVPAGLQGTWVPAKATCESPSRIVLTSDRLTLVNGSDQQAIGGIEMAGSGYFGPEYTGIMQVLITEFEGQQPVTMTFNLDEEKGTAQAEFAMPMTGGNSQMAAYNARVNQLSLAKRFPLNKVPLKKCAGAAPGK